MRGRALAQALQRNEAVAFHAFATADDLSRRRFGFSVVRRAGTVCYASTRLPDALFNRALGFGVLAPATPAVAGSVLRHYAALGAIARIELALDVVPAAAVRVLERLGFRRERETHLVHALVAGEPPRVRAPRALRVEEVRRRELRIFGLLARAGFEATGERGDFVERSSRYVLGHRTRGTFVGYIGWVGNEPVATGAVCFTRDVGGLYSDTTLPGWRGRGIQKAMIATRVARGLGRGVRTFGARTEGSNVSARNYAAVGFVPLYRAGFWSREP